MGRKNHKETRGKRLLRMRKGVYGNKGNIECVKINNF